MGVTTDGIKGYEYQYKVTLLIALLYNEATELLVELKGSEDALLRLKQGNSLKSVEIQVKRENKSLSIDTLVDWLCHFQEHKADSNLLSRLVNNPQTMALFVTQSRCADDIVFLQNQLGIIENANKISIDANWKGSFINSLSNQKLGNTKLDIEREEFCKKQANDYKKNILKFFKSLFGKISVWEKCFENEIDEKIVKELNNKFKISISNTNNVYLELLEIIKEARDKGSNAIIDINKLLKSKKTGHPILISDYMHRVEESELIERLKKEGVLLLTGVSHCGKSEIAKKISLNFFEEGYKYKNTDKTEEVIRFFSENIGENLVALLEDPFGHAELNSNSNEEKYKIQKILSNLDNSNKIIITSRLEILEDLFYSKNIDEFKINDFNWIDLTLYDTDYICNYWIKISDKLSDNIKILVLNGLKQGNNLQMGQLSYLSKQSLNDKKHNNFDLLEHSARHNSEEISRSIRKKGKPYDKVLSVLAICANTIIPVSYENLAYILDDREYEHIFILGKDILNVDKNKMKTLNYQENYEIKEEVKIALEYLEERGFITINQDEIVFNHPDYYEAGRYLFHSKSTIVITDFISKLKKVIFSLNYQNAYTSTKQLYFIYNKLENDTHKKEILDIAFLALHSIFPAVQDYAFTFIISVIEDISDKQETDLVRYIKNDTFSGLYIHWNTDNTPFLQRQGTSFDDWEHLFYVGDKDNILKIENNLYNNKLPDLQSSWDYLRIYGLHRELNIPVGNFAILLNHTESFIRSKVVEVIFLAYKKIPNNILDIIFNDEHPNVIFNAIRFSIINWFNFTNSARKNLHKRIEKSLYRKDVVVRSYELIATFSIDYSSEGIYNLNDLNQAQQKEIWNTWVKLYIQVVENFSIISKIRINTARFSVSMNIALEMIDEKLGIQVIEAWYERIDIRIQTGQIIDQFEIVVSDNLIQLTKDNYKIRHNLFHKIISHHNTSFLLANLSWILSNWEYLHTSEKDTVMNILTLGRTDTRWIKALFVNNFNTDIAFNLFVEYDFFNKNESYIISKFSDQFICDCLHIYFGKPQPLCWLGLDHNNSEFWNRIIKYILLHESHVAYDMCLREFLMSAVNGASEDTLDTFKVMCKNNQNKDIILDKLILNACYVNCSLPSLKKMFNILIEEYKNADKYAYVLRIIANNIELLQETNDLQDLLQIFDKKFLFDDVISYINDDYILIQDIQNDIAGNLDTDFILSKIDASKIHFIGTVYYILYILGKKDDNLLTIVGFHIKERNKKVLEDFRSTFEFKIDDWNGM